MHRVGERPPRARRLLRWIDRLFSGVPRSHLLTLFVAGTALLVTRSAIFMPVTVGWNASTALVQKQDELAELQRQAGDYSAAAVFYGSPAGRENARSLVLKVPEEGERRALLQPPPEAAPRPRGTRAWLSDKEAALDRTLKWDLRVLKMWANGPPPELADRKPPPPRATAKAGGEEGH
jgi:hypothetical protein